MPILPQASASAVAVRFCVGRREPLRTSRASIQGISDATCDAVIWPFTPDAT
jgi:hypothetical protein